MPAYSMFGGVLDSAIAFDGLQPATANVPTWTFRVDHDAPALGPLVPIGSERVSDDLSILLARGADGSVVLRYSGYGLGDFVVAADGRNISWRPAADPWREALRWVLLGRVMTVAMYVGGTLCLHGSAISMGTEAICFLAPKCHGKSTLAAALVASGARLAADDLLPIEAGPPVRIRPGVPVLRLWGDSVNAIRLGGRGMTYTADDVGKARFDFADPASVIASSEPLAAIYILAPAREEPAPGKAVVRSLVQGLPALELVVRHSSIAPIVEASEARLLMTHAAAIVRSVPVYMLRSIRDLQRLPDVVSQMRRWHKAPSHRSSAVAP